MFYATVRYVDEQVTFNQFDSVEVNDLYRFETKKERDQFVADNDCADVILSADARVEYKEQFNFWRKNN